MIPYLVGLIELGIWDVVLGSCIRPPYEALAGGIPIWKYSPNRVLTILESVALGPNLGDLPSGLLVYRREELEAVPFLASSDDFVFDMQFLVQCAYFGYRLGGVPMRYFEEVL